MADASILASGPQRRLGRPSVWRRLRRHPAACGSLIYLLALCVIVTLGPVLFDLDPSAQDFDLFGQPQPPSASHWLGTDELGRDVLARLIHGGRISVSIGLASSLVATLIGTGVGAAAGYYGGWVDRFLMRVVDIVLCIPMLPLILLLSALVKPSPELLVLMIGALSWMGTSRLVRSQFLVLRKRDFVEAARGLGMSNLRLMARHILPNALAPIIVAATLAVGGGIMIESAMSFLGLGVQPPTPTWGNMLNAASPWLPVTPLIAVSPGLMIFLTVIAVNFLGDGLRDLLDPH